MALYFYFSDNRLNLVLYFTVTTVVLYLAPDLFPSAAHRAPVVVAPAGKVSGYKLVSREGRQISAYLGLPFAEPPVGHLRFARPVPRSSPWEGVRDGTVKPPICVQPGRFSNSGQEDCLYLNIYVPERSTSQQQTKLPVMAYIHGGGFATGDASDYRYGPRYLLDRDVILVVMQYRLGPLGFLNLGYREKAGGNQALWDQKEALKWIQRNIAAFGGDPGRVTLFGESAGSMSVMYHLLSGEADKVTGNNVDVASGKKKKKKKALFHAAIAQSGGFDTPFLKLEQNTPLVDYHRQYAKELGCPSERNSQKLLECLLGKSTDELMAGMNMFDECNLLDEEDLAFPGVWSPSNDASLSNNPFFTDNPLKMSREGKFLDVPLMIGSTKHDGLFTISNLLKDPKKFEKLVEEFVPCMANNMFGKRYDQVNDQDIQLVGKIRDFYFGDRNYKLDLNLELERNGKEGGVFRNWTNAFTDSAFAYGTDVIVSTLTSKSKTPVFYYRFDHLGSFSLADVFSADTFQYVTTALSKLVGYHTTSSLGVCHADDVLYLFSSSSPLTLLPAEIDQDTSRLMVNLWTNFATHHDPTPASLPSQKWKPATMEEKTMARIENAKLNFERDMDYERRMGFWRDMVIGETK